MKRDKVYLQLIISGTGILVFTETVNKEEFCEGNIYPINHPNTTIELTTLTTTPDGLPKMERGAEFCLLYANPNYYMIVQNLVLHRYYDVAEYTMGNSSGTLSKYTGFREYTNNSDLEAACFYFELVGTYQQRDVLLTVDANLSIPYRDMVPLPSVEPATDHFTKSKEFSPSHDFSASIKFLTPNHPTASSIILTPKPTQTTHVVAGIKTPTPTRKVHILTDNPFESPTVEISNNKNYRAIVIKSPLTGSEIATVATTASLMIGMIVAAVILFLIYIRSKARRMKERELTFDDSDITDTSSSQVYSYSYTYYYTSYTEHDSYSLSGSQQTLPLKQIKEQPSEEFSAFYANPNTI